MAEEVPAEKGAALSSQLRELERGQPGQRVLALPSGWVLCVVQWTAWPFSSVGCIQNLCVLLPWVLKWVLSLACAVCGSQRSGL